MMFNFKEGMRRVGLLAGILSALCCCVPAYQDLHHAWRFHRLSNSELLSSVARAAWDPQFIPDGYETTIQVPPNADGVKEVTLRNYNRELVTIKVDCPWDYEYLSKPGFSDWITPLWYPLLGFLLPWLAVRIIVWLVTGFLQKQTQVP
jgi:hypothetical protein